MLDCSQMCSLVYTDHIILHVAIIVKATLLFEKCPVQEMTVSPDE